MKQPILYKLLNCIANEKIEISIKGIASRGKHCLDSQGPSYLMPAKTNILPVKTKCSNQLIMPLHIAPSAHQLHGAQR